MLYNSEILKRLDKLQDLMNEVPTSLVCNWEVITINKIKRLFEMGLLFGSGHMQVLNKFYKDYKYRKGLVATDEQILNYRKWDLLFSEHENDKLLYKLKFDYWAKEYGKTNKELPEIIKTTQRNIKEIKRNLEDLSIKFDDDDIMKIRISKKIGDLVMIENPFDDEHQFPAVISSSSITNEKITSNLRNSIEWYKQSDPSVTGKSVITEYELIAHNTG